MPTCMKTVRWMASEVLVGDEEVLIWRPFLESVVELVNVNNSVPSLLSAKDSTRISFMHRRRHLFCTFSSTCLFIFFSLAPSRGYIFQRWSNERFVKRWIYFVFVQSGEIAAEWHINHAGGLFNNILNVKSRGKSITDSNTKVPLAGNFLQVHVFKGVLVLNKQCKQYFLFLLSSCSCVTSMYNFCNCAYKRRGLRFTAITTMREL